MASLSINQARRVLGKDAHGVSDSDLEQFVETATLLSDIFFNKYNKSRLGVVKDTQKCHNVAVYGNESCNLHKSI